MATNETVVDSVVSGSVGETVKTRKKRTVYKVTPLEFSQAWNAAAQENGGGLTKVSEVLGMPLPVLQARASGYRKIGVKLLDMPRRTRSNGISVEDINRQLEVAGTTVSE